MEQNQTEIVQTEHSLEKKLLDARDQIKAMEQRKTEVVVTNIKMPFWSMVCFLVKLVIAAIPAMIILWGIVAIMSLVLAIFTFGR